MTARRLWALDGARLTMDRAEMLDGADPGPVELIVPTFLVEHDDGLVLFDTGLAPEAADDPVAAYGEIGHQVSFTDDRVVDRRLAALGFATTDVRRHDNAVPVSAVSIRPSLVTSGDTYDGYIRRTRESALAPSFNQWTFVDADDLGDLALRAATISTPGHEVVYAAQPDNIRGEPLADLLAEAYGDEAPTLRALERPDAGAIDVAKARRLFGWAPRTGLAAR